MMRITKKKNTKSRIRQKNDARLLVRELRKKFHNENNIQTIIDISIAKASNH